MSAPVLRFRSNGKDYPDWKETTLSEITEFRSSKANSTNDKYIGTENILQKCAGIVPNNDEMPRRGTAFFKDDILSSNIRPYLKKSWFATWDGIASNDVLVFKVLKGVPKFVYLLLSSDSYFHYAMKGSKPGNKMPRGDKDYIKNMVVAIPSDEEQRLIANFFSDIDDQLENYRQSLDNLEAQRKELLQQVFSRKLRFKKDDGKDYPAWKEKKISDFADVQMCKRILKRQTTTKGEIPFYKIGTLGGTPDAYIPRSLFEEYKSRYKYPKKGEVLMTCSGTIGKCLLFDGHDSYYQDSNIVWLRNNDNTISNKFVYYCISFNGCKASSTDGIIGRLYTKDLKNIQFAFPCPEEQQKIADFFSDLDERIELERQRLQTMQDIKKGLLQQMFC